jgi:hypothetical protein
MKKLIVAIFILFVASPVFSSDSLFGDNKLYDFVILLDESGSMNHNDPFNVRRPSCKRIIDKLKLSGLANRISLIKFAARADNEYAQLSLDYEKLYTALDSGLSRTGKKKKYTSLEDCPDRGFTDTYAALKKAYGVLSDSPTRRNSKVVEKVVFLLTDGVVEPWPGSVTSTRDKYLKSVLNGTPGFCFKGDKNENPYCNEARDVSKRLIIENLLPKFRQKGFRIYAVGFGDADEQFLRALSRTTLADYKKLENYYEIDDLIDGYMPSIANKIQILSDRLCDTRSIKFKVSDNLEVLAITVNFTKHIEDLMVAAENDIGLSIRSPAGDIYDSKTGVSYRTPRDKNNKAHYSHAYLHTINPEPGQWEVSLSPSGYKNVCGEIKAEARLNKPPVLEVSPIDGDFEANTRLKITAWMPGKNNSKIQLDRVSGKVESADSESTLHFERRSDNRYVALFTPLKKGDYRIIADYVIGKGHVKREEIIHISPEKPCTLSLYCFADERLPISLKDGIHLGILGYPVTRAGKRIEVLSGGCSSPLNISITPLSLIHENDSNAVIPEDWLTISSAEVGMHNNDQSKVLEIILEMKPEIPSNLLDGKYSGMVELRVSEGEDIMVPVTVVLELPGLMLNGTYLQNKMVRIQGLPELLQSTLTFDFTSSLTTFHKEQLNFKITAGAKGKNIYYEVTGDPEKLLIENNSPFKLVSEKKYSYIVEAKNITSEELNRCISELTTGITGSTVLPLGLDLMSVIPYFVTSTDGNPISGINISMRPSTHLELNADTLNELTVSLTNKNTDISRIPRGAYHANLILSGEYLRTCYLPVSILIPEQTEREKWFRWLFGKKKFQHQTRKEKL